MKNTEKSYRTKDGKAQIEWSLEQKKEGLTFSASGTFDGSAGQCIDKIAKAYPNDQTVQSIAKVWRVWHLNDLKAGTPEQEKAVKEWLASGNTYDYTKINDMLKKKRLYEVLAEDKKSMYKYGHAWLFAPIPQDVIDEIRSWTSNANEPLAHSNADNFLKSNNLKIRITLSDSKPANWEPAGHHYRVTLSGTNRRMTFDFWGSVNDAEKDEDPNAYDVLACISGDVNSPEDFEEFCSEYGYDQDSIKSLQTFKRVDRFAKRLRAFFTETEQEQLQEIR